MAQPEQHERPPPPQETVTGDGGSHERSKTGLSGAPAAADGEDGITRAMVFDRLFPGKRPPEELGGMRILERIGEGGMGVVYAAYDPQLDRKVAVKLMRPRAGKREGDTARHRARLLREAQTLARLSHPNVVTVYQVGAVGDRVFVAMEFLRGETLDAYLRHHPLPWRERVALLRKAGEGLAAAHDAGLVHRDIKPENVIVSDSGEVKVLDFGLARDRKALSAASDDDNAREPTHPGDDRESDRDAIVTRAGAIVGTPAYMPPEQWRGELVTPASDQFSFCQVLYESLYDESPFPITSLEARVAAIEDGVISPAPRGAGVPSWLRQVIVRGLATSPKERWPSMRALLDALARDPARRARRVIAVAALALGVGSLGYGLALQGDQRLAACDGARGRLAGIWDDARAESLAAAFTGSSVAYADDTWSRVEARLETYADAWVTVHEEACREHASGSRSDSLLDLQMTCLDRRRVELGALLDVLADANPEAIERAVRAVVKLPAPARCADTEALTAPIEPPPADRLEEIDAIEARMARATAMGRLGQLEEGLEVARDARAAAEALGYAPLVVGAMLAEVHLLENLDTSAAEPLYTELLWKAHTAKLDRAALAAASDLLFTQAYLNRGAAVALQWEPLARSLLARTNRENTVDHADFLHAKSEVLWHEGSYDEAETTITRALSMMEEDDPARASLLRSLGNIQWRKGDFKGAEETHRRVLEIQRAVLGEGHPEIGISLLNLSNTIQEQGRIDESRALLRETLALYTKALGPEHVKVAKVLDTIGSLEQEQGNPDKAVPLQQQALAIFEKALEPNNPTLAIPLNNLSNTMFSLKRYDEALALSERALAIRKAAYGEDHYYIGISFINIAGIHRKLGNLETALDYATRSLATIEKAMGADHPDTAFVCLNLAAILEAMDRADEARPYIVRSLEIREAKLPPDHPSTMATMGALGQLDVDRGRYAEAHALLTKVREVCSRSKDACHAEQRTKARFALGRAAWELGRRAEARADVDAAEALAREHEYATVLDHIETWRKEHP